MILPQNTRTRRTYLCNFHIGPMFHKEVLGVDSKNLDLFFSSQDELRKEYAKHAADAELVITEGVMGYYDGMRLDSVTASSYDVARTLDIPAVLILPCKGAALSLCAVVSGIVSFQKDSNIQGIILNRVSKMLYPRLKKMLEDHLKSEGYDIGKAFEFSLCGNALRHPLCV